MARFALHASKTSWLWQDMRAMYPKSPTNRRRRIHRAKILPGRGPFRCTDPSNHARRADLAIRRRRTTLAPTTSVPPNSASRPKAQRESLAAANPGGCPHHKRSPPHACISSLRRGFALFRRKHAPTIHIYPPYPWRGFPADAPRTAAFPATQENVEARRALPVVHWAESACHQHFVNAKSTAIFEHDNTRLKAAIPPEPCQHVHRFAVHAPHFAIFRPAVHVCILEQVFV